MFSTALHTDDYIRTMTMSEFEVLRANLAATRGELDCRLPGIGNRAAGREGHAAALDPPRAGVRTSLDEKPEAAVTQQAAPAVFAAMFTVMFATVAGTPAGIEATSLLP